MSTRHPVREGRTSFYEPPPSLEDLACDKSAPHRTAPHRTAPHRTAPHRTAPHRTAPHRTTSHRIAPHRTAQKKSEQHRPVEYVSPPRISDADATVTCCQAVRWDALYRTTPSGNCDYDVYLIRYSIGSSLVPLNASGKYQHYSGNWHYSAYCRYWLFPSVSSNFTGTVAGGRYYSTGTIEEALLLCTRSSRACRAAPAP